MSPWRWAVGLTIMAGGVSAARPCGATPRRCVEPDTPAVGTAECSRFGDDWAIERAWPIALRAGARYDMHSIGSTQWSSADKKNPSGRFSGSALGLRSLSAIGIESAVTFDVVRGLYIGIEGALGYGSARPASVIRSSRVFADTSGLDLTFWHAAIPFGYRIHLGPITVRAELAFGRVGVNLSHLVLPLSPPGAVADIGVTGTSHWLVEPRLGAEVWLSRHVSLGAYAGLGLVEASSGAGGFAFTFHNRPFAGR